MFSPSVRFQGEKRRLMSKILRSGKKVFFIRYLFSIENVFSKKKTLIKNVQLLVAKSAKADW